MFYKNQKTTIWDKIITNWYNFKIAVKKFKKKKTTRIVFITCLIIIYLYFVLATVYVIFLYILSKCSIFIYKKLWSDKYSFISIIKNINWTDIVWEVNPETGEKKRRTPQIMKQRLFKYLYKRFSKKFFIFTTNYSSFKNQLRLKIMGYFNKRRAKQNNKGIFKKFLEIYNKGIHFIRKKFKLNLDSIDFLSFKTYYRWDGIVAKKNEEQATKLKYVKYDPSKDYFCDDRVTHPSFEKWEFSKYYKITDQFRATRYQYFMKTKEWYWNNFFNKYVGFLPTDEEKEMYLYFLEDKYNLYNVKFFNEKTGFYDHYYLYLPDKFDTFSKSFYNKHPFKFEDIYYLSDIIEDGRISLIDQYTNHAKVCGDVIRFHLKDSHRNILNTYIKCRDFYYDPMFKHWYEQPIQKEVSDIWYPDHIEYNTVEINKPVGYNYKQSGWPIPEKKPKKSEDGEEEEEEKEEVQEEEPELSEQELLEQDLLEEPKQFSDEYYEFSEYDFLNEIWLYLIDSNLILIAYISWLIIGLLAIWLILKIIKLSFKLLKFIVKFISVFFKIFKSKPRKIAISWFFKYTVYLRYCLIKDKINFFKEKLTRLFFFISKIVNIIFKCCVILFKFLNGFLYNPFKSEPNTELIPEGKEKREDSKPGTWRPGMGYYKK